MQRLAAGKLHGAVGGDGLWPREALAWSVERARSLQLAEPVFHRMKWEE